MLLRLNLKTSAVGGGFKIYLEKLILDKLNNVNSIF